MIGPHIVPLNVWKIAIVWQKNRVHETVPSWIEFLIIQSTEPLASVFMNIESGSQIDFL